MKRRMWGSTNIGDFQQDLTILSISDKFEYEPAKNDDFDYFIIKPEICHIEQEVKLNEKKVI